MIICAKYNESFVQHETIIPTFYTNFEKKLLFQSTLSVNYICESYKMLIYNNLHLTL